MIERVSTGIVNLDDVVGGGYPKERTILVAGPAGAGKSTFALAFLVDGIIRADEPGIYVSFDESLENVRQDALSFGWDLAELESQNRLAMIDGFSPRAGIESNEKYKTPLEVDEMLNLLISVIDEIGAERIVIDSITAIALGLDDEIRQRKEILKLSAVMSALSTTTIMVSEMKGSDEISRFGIEEFMAQAVIVLKYVFTKSGRRTLQVRKMRGVKHNMSEMPFIMTDNGLICYPHEELYEM